MFPGFNIKKMKRTLVAGIAVTLLLFMGCKQKDKNQKPLDSPTSGTIEIAVDESLKPLIEAEVDAFEATYPKAKINVKYVSESEAVHLMLTDSARLAIVTRQLTAEETKILTDLTLKPQYSGVAKEAITLVTNKNNPDSLFQWNDLQAILKGETSAWSKLKINGKNAPVEIVFDSPNSGIVKFVKDSVLQITQLPPNCFAVNSSEAVIDYVSKKENAIGLIGASWISDRNDSTANVFLKAVRVAGISNGKDAEFYQPYQAYIAQGNYKLTRNITIISREPRSGLGSGFMSYVASPKGQRVVLKAGLVPVTMPIRIVEVNQSPIQ